MAGNKRAKKSKPKKKSAQSGAGVRKLLAQYWDETIDYLSLQKIELPQGWTFGKENYLRNGQQIPAYPWQKDSAKERVSILGAKVNLVSVHDFCFKGHFLVWGLNAGLYAGLLAWSDEKIRVTVVSENPEQDREDLLILSDEQKERIRFVSLDEIGDEQFDGMLTLDLGNLWLSGVQLDDLYVPSKTSELLGKRIQEQIAWMASHIKEGGPLIALHENPDSPAFGGWTHALLSNPNFEFIDNMDFEAPRNSSSFSQYAYLTKWMVMPEIPEDKNEETLHADFFRLIISNAAEVLNFSLSKGKKLFDNNSFTAFLANEMVPFQPIGGFEVLCTSNGRPDKVWISLNYSELDEGTLVYKELHLDPSNNQLIELPLMDQQNSESFLHTAISKLVSQFEEKPIVRMLSQEELRSFWNEENYQNLHGFLSLGDEDDFDEDEDDEGWPDEDDFDELLLNERWLDENYEPTPEDKRMFHRLFGVDWDDDL